MDDTPTHRNYRAVLYKDDDGDLSVVIVDAPTSQEAIDSLTITGYEIVGVSAWAIAAGGLGAPLDEVKRGGYQVTTDYLRAVE